MSKISPDRLIDSNAAPELLEFDKLLARGESRPDPRLFAGFSLP